MFLTQLFAGPATSVVGAGTSDWWRHMDGWGHMGWGHMGGWGAGSGLLVTLAVLAVVAAVVAAAVALARSARSDRPPADAPGAQDRTDPEERARLILAERYARGEIGTDEYRERLHELR
ncbi:MAG: hypothetical protein ACLGIA_03090 [Actinomycetes bacterium]